MSLIGSFKRSGSDFIGDIFTLTVTVQNVRIVKEDAPAGDTSPTHRIFSGRAEIGAAWRKTAQESKREYLSVKIDDCSLTQPINANLYIDDNGDANLVWTRLPATA
jgi:uncharacterized protein (DUF736 family)